MEPSEALALAQREEARRNAAPSPADEKLELAILRKFFEQWEALHGIALDDKGARQKSEQAAQILVDTAHAVRALRGAH